MVQKGGSRRNASLAEQSRGQKVWSAIQSNILGDSIDKDIHHESIGQREGMKYLRESYYHRIECSAPNSLTTLMWKWYLNSNFQPYSYSQRLQEGTDGTGINTSNLVYTWRVEMEKEDSIKEKEYPKEVGLEEE